ncbi:uncharacterized protein EKO05_0010684 [Ascochyta rabiei]|uniref:uncharacterized protein n=1 Tax=Didymella rabiei TaxID=5454 RepID=UPI002202284E|nr:uncharacterized protein EKO05_0010684 [Ascochyta rabiei]UPX20454.1 hypothetical protein EKO05_0010684 [Ascochyta rabiei]
MAASVVYDNVAEGVKLETGRLFESRKFWVAQHVPHRSALLDLIRANGGHITLLEKQADWMIADHFRKGCPPASISYEFVHKSVAKGEILDPSDFPAGPRIGTARDPGSLVRPAKGARNAYTPDEDRILYNWVKDAAAAGVATSGNELYKQLEQKCPRHTWQSWRDRYLKQLQGRPASAFSVPADTPPSDQSSRADEAPVEKKEALVKDKEQVWSTTEPEACISEEQAASDEYTVKQLAATFSTEDWEELYALVDHIDNLSKDTLSYQASWANWAKDMDNQTAAQWQQYYEKIVRPQWLRDPVSKRERIRKRVEEKHLNDSSSPNKSQSWSQAQDKTVDALQTAPDALRSDSRLESDLTAQHETPNYIRDGYESAFKRIRGDLDDVPEAAEAVRPAKRRRVSLSPTLVKMEEPVDVVGTREQPLKIPSTTSSRQTSAEPQLSEVTHPHAQVIDEADDTESLLSEDGFAHPPRPPIVLQDEDDLESTASSIDLAHIAPLPRPLQVPETEEDDEHLPSNTPTPRASKYTTFDTQANLSSPSQLPRPPVDSSPPHHPESDASTTQSIEEFRRSLLEDDPSTQTERRLPRLPRPASPTPSTTSSASSTTSADPDEPLLADEIDDFFTSQHAAGFSDEFIAKALKRTRFRPGLATAVLEAWKHGLPLPSQRGIWSAEDDEQVERGDGLCLTRLAEKHTLDGWGGITERLNWLRAWRQ